MSDMTEYNDISGNFEGRWHLDGHMDGDAQLSPCRPRPLVEEFEHISVADIRNLIKRKQLIALAEQKRAISIRHDGQGFEIMLSADRHQQTWRARGVSDVTRVWLRCSCGRRVRHLYFNHLSSDPEPILSCRTCLKLRYLSQNSGKTKWFRRSVLPIRKLLRKKKKLLSLKPTDRIHDDLQLITEQIYVLEQRAKPKGKSQRHPGVRRKYRDMNLVIDYE